MEDKDHDSFFDDEMESRKPEADLMALIGAYDKTSTAEIEAGQRAKGKVLSIGTEYVFVDIGGKNEAMMDVAECTNKAGEITVKPGNTIEAYVVSTKNNEVMLSNSLGGHKVSTPELINAMKAGLPVDGRVSGVNKGGFNVTILGHRAFCPISQIDAKYVEDPMVYISKSLPFVITRITEGGRNIVVSRLPILEKEIEKRIGDIEQAIERKDVLTGTISRIADFGLFVDLGGIEGLVHISEVSWERAHDLAGSFSVGQAVECVVLKIERRQPLRDTKISLSIKQVLDDPWSTVSQRLHAGDLVEGTITRLANFGAFVQLLPGIDGLIHVSEMRWGQRVNHPSEVVAVGNRVHVTILAIDEAKRSVSCSLKDVADDPWHDLDAKLSPGTLVKGTVSSKARYGYFIDLLDGVTGLLVFCNIAADKKDSLKPGDSVEVTVESVDTERRRISLTMGLAEARKEEASAREFIARQKQEKPQQASEFGDMLRAALEKKK